MQKRGLLVDLVNSFTSRQLFFVVWALVAGISVLMMVKYLQKVTRRNFKKDSGAPKSTLPAHLARKSEKSELTRKRN
jgi:hypothetical protein